ncbi:MAG: hypothetical protein M9894_37570 [Planctomycetes bacterium]|nr:hypothetical protein [Planctomycetota bacterium]
MGKASRSLCVLLALTTVLGPGCATILGKAAAQPVDVTTTPPGAKLSVDGIPVEQVSPATIHISPREEHSVSAQLGEAKANRAIKKTVRIWAVVVDGILTAGIGVFVDYMTGALYQFEPKVHLNLGVSPPPSPSPDPGVATNRPPPQQRQENCKVCGELRPVGAGPCPHCGMD